MLLLASVLGRSFDRDLLSRLLPREEVESGSDPLAGLEEQLIADQADRLRFRHAVLQEAAYETLSFRTRLAMHRRVGEVIEAARSGIAMATPLLSLHFFAAHDWVRTWRYARLAADTAKAEHAPSEVVAHLERAVTAARHLSGTATDRERASVLTDLGIARELLGEYQSADDAFRRAELVSSLDPFRRAELADRRAYIRSEYLGRPSAAIRQLRSAQARLTALQLSETDEYWIRALLSAREADVRVRQARFPEGLESSRRAAHEAERGNNTRALALALAVQDHCLVLTNRSAEAKNFARALELYESLGDHVRVALTLNNVAIAAYYNSQWELAATRLQEASEAFTKAGDLVHASTTELNLGDIRLNQGRWEEAEAILSSARRTLEACGYQLMAALAAMTLGRTRVFLGDVDSGFTLLLSAASALDEIGSPMDRLEVQARLAEALIFTGRYDEARMAFEKARDLERSSTGTTLSPLVDRIELSLAIATGETSSAISSVESALERARQVGADYEVLMVQALAERVGTGEGDEEAARLRRDLGVVRLPMFGDR
jgi:tetratricopeptide (TPR) repeat protein